jgi:hypothetical protein
MFIKSQAVDDGEIPEFDPKLPIDESSDEEDLDDGDETPEEGTPVE